MRRELNLSLNPGGFVHSMWHPTSLKLTLSVILDISSSFLHDWKLCIFFSQYVFSADLQEYTPEFSYNWFIWPQHSVVLSVDMLTLNHWYKHIWDHRVKHHSVYAERKSLWKENCVSSMSCWSRLSLMLLSCFRTAEVGDSCLHSIMLLTYRCSLMI